MCYPKPGPRCSAHARKAYKLAVAAYRAEPSLENKEREACAEEEFLMTPEGFRYLEKRIQSGYDAEWDAERLSFYQTMRAESIAQLKLKDDGDIKHSQEYNRSQELVSLTKGSSIDGWNMGGKSGALVKEQQLIEDSAAWVDKLSLDEVKAVEYFTSFGFHELGQHHRGEPLTEYEDGLTSEDRTSRAVKMKALLDSALEKADGKARVSYRGLSEHSCPSELKMYSGSSAIPSYKRVQQFESSAEQEEAVSAWLDKIESDGTVTFALPASSSADAGKAVGFTGAQYCPAVMYEVLSKKGGPASLSSEWSSEAEIIMQSGTYKVAGVKKNAVVNVMGFGGQPVEREVHLIQLMDNE